MDTIGKLLSAGILIFNTRKKIKEEDKQKILKKYGLKVDKSKEFEIDRYTDSFGD